MLPSTGFFKAIACPFYEDGSCDRPYCHFKHTRRDDSASVLASTSSSTELGQVLPKNAGVGLATAVSGTTDTLSQLVSEAVKKVLAEQLVADKEEISQNIVSKVVEELKPTLAGSLQTTAVPIETSSVPPVSTLPIANSSSSEYHPTPIDELKKRHISIPIYNPVRESRITVKRKGSPDIERSRSWQLKKAILLKTDDNEDTSYTPTPVSGTNNSEYIPTPGYVPTAKSTPMSMPASSYDSNSNDTYVSKTKEPYYPSIPKPKSRREEYVPRKVKKPVNPNSVSLEEFDIMDEVLCMNTINQDSNSQDFMDMESTFSDEEVDSLEQKDDNDKTNLDENTEDIVESNDTNKEEKNRLVAQENESKNLKQSTDKKDCKDSHRKSSSRSRSSDNEKKSSKTDEQVNGSSRHKNKDREREKDLKKKSDKKHSSSSSKHDEKSKHSLKRSSSRSSSKHSTSSRDSIKKKDNRDKDKKDKSRNNSHKSKKSSKSDKESNDKHRKKSGSSSSSREDKSKDKKTTLDTSKHHEKSKKNSKKDEQSTKSNSVKKEKDSVLDERLFLSEKDLFDDSDVDIEEECYKIFQEYEESDQPKSAKVSYPAKREHEDVEEDVSRKRIAHPSAESCIIRKPGPSQPMKKVPNPQQKLYERWRLMKEAAAEKAKFTLATQINETSANSLESVNNVSLHSKSSSYTNSNETYAFNGNNKVRIAHVPYAMSLAKKPVQEKLKEPEVRTAAQTNKSKLRVAHVPQTVPQLIRPEPLEATTQKFSLNIRQFYVNMMHDVCVRIYTNGADAVQRALAEEFACYERCKALNVYKNSCMLAIHRLKKEVEQEKLEITAPSVSGTVSHEAVLAGKSKGSWSVMKPKKLITNFKGTALYQMLTKWILAEQQLKDNGYPRPHPNGHKGYAKVYTIDSRNHSIPSKVPNERTCSRCGEMYMVDKKGFPIRQQNCIYHWGRKFTIRGEGRYSCCQQYGSASGCADAKMHVWDFVDYENLRGYVKTLPKDLPDEEQGVYSLDCEMSYTTQGLELTRVTVINEDCQVVYETLVRPENPIIDYNTRFSGITEEAMKNVTTTILDVQATLLTMFSSKTILVGHSLESDFKALKLIHDTVVDTSVMFPHRNGHPQKRALKNLCSEYLRKIIQNDVSGHDSNEDAVSCMELVLWKVKEEAKLQ